MASCGSADSAQSQTVCLQLLTLRFVDKVLCCSSTAEFWRVILRQWCSLRIENLSALSRMNVNNFKAMFHKKQCRYPLCPGQQLFLIQNNCLSIITLPFVETLQVVTLPPMVQQWLRKAFQRGYERCFLNKHLSFFKQTASLFLNKCLNLQA